MGRIHVKVKDQKCEQCSFASFSKQSLSNHVKAGHLQEKEEVGNICDLKTFLKTELDRHIAAVHIAVKSVHSVNLSQHLQNT